MTNKLIFLLFCRIKMHGAKGKKNLTLLHHLTRYEFKPALQHICSIARHFYYSMFESILPYAIIKPRLLWIIVLGGSAAAAAVIVFYLPGLRLPDKEEFQLFKASHFFERYE